MNKLVLSTKDVLKENLEVLEITGNKTELRIEGNTEVDSILFPSVDFTTTWILKKNAVVKFCLAQEIENINGIINIISEENTNLLFQLGVYAGGNNNLVINNMIQEDNVESNIKIRVATKENAKMYLRATGDILENTKSCFYVEDIKYLNEYPGTITCLPELLVKSDDAVASHNMTASNVDEDSLFYLESRGLSEEIARNLIRKNFIEAMARKDRYL